MAILMLNNTGNTFSNAPERKLNNSEGSRNIKANSISAHLVCLFLFLSVINTANASGLENEMLSPDKTKTDFDVVEDLGMDYDFVIEAGLKPVNRQSKGFDSQSFDVRPYVQVGLYRPVGTQWRVGSAMNFAPNIVNSGTQALLNFKILDVFYLLNNQHSVSFYGGAQRLGREYTAWGYSLGFGYGYRFKDYTIRTNISWARTNTDVGGPSYLTGAKDNLVWLNIGLEF